MDVELFFVFLLKRIFGCRLACARKQKKWEQTARRQPQDFFWDDEMIFWLWFRPNHLFENKIAKLLYFSNFVKSIFAIYQLNKQV